MLYVEGLSGVELNRILSQYIHSVRTLNVISRGGKLASQEQLGEIIQAKLSNNFILSPGTMIRCHFGFRHDSYKVDPENHLAKEIAIFQFPSTDEDLLKGLEWIGSRDQPIVQVPNFGGIGQGELTWMNEDFVPSAPKTRDALRDVFRQNSVQYYPYYGGFYAVSGRQVAGRNRNSSGNSFLFLFSFSSFLTFFSIFKARDPKMMKLIQQLDSNLNVPNVSVAAGSKSSCYSSLFSLIGSKRESALSPVKDMLAIRLFCIPSVLLTQEERETIRQMVPRTSTRYYTKVYSFLSNFFSFFSVNYFLI